MAILISAVGIVLMLFFWLDAKLNKITDKLGEHDAADQVLAECIGAQGERVGTLEQDMKEIKSGVDEIRGFLIGREAA